MIDVYQNPHESIAAEIAPMLRQADKIELYATVGHCRFDELLRDAMRMSIETWHAVDADEREHKLKKVEKKKK